MLLVAFKACGLKARIGKKQEEVHRWGEREREREREIERERENLVPFSFVFSCGYIW